MRPFREMKTKELQRIEDWLIFTTIVSACILLCACILRWDAWVFFTSLAVTVCSLGFGLKYINPVLMARKQKPPEEPKKLTELDRRLAMAETLYEADRIRKKFLADKGIPEGSELADQVNALFTEYEIRLKDPESE